MSLNASKQSGYIYVLSNKSFPDLYKVGYTTRELNMRVAELSGSTGVPTPFIIEYSQHFNNCIEAEKVIHSMLDIHGGRVASNREFFKLSLESVIDTVKYVKKVLDKNEGGYVVEEKVLPIEKIYIKEAKEIIDRERILGGEKKAENKLKEAAILGDREAYFLLGKLYNEESFETTYSIDKSIKMYHQVIKMESETDKKYSEESLGIVTTMLKTELRRLINEKSSVKSQTKKSRQLQSRINDLQIILKNIWKDYLSSFETKHLLSMSLDDIFDILSQLIKSNWKYYITSSTYGWIPSNRNILNAIIYYTRDYHLENEMPYMNTKLKPQEKHIIKSMYVDMYSKLQLLRRPKFDILSIESNTKLTYSLVQIKVLNDTIQKEDVLTIINKNNENQHNTLYVVESITVNNNNVKRIEENEIGIIKLVRSIDENDYINLRNGTGYLVVTGNCSNGLPTISKKKIEAFGRIANVFHQIKLEKEKETEGDTSEIGKYEINLKDETFNNDSITITNNLSDIDEDLSDKHLIDSGSDLINNPNNLISNDSIDNDKNLSDNDPMDNEPIVNEPIYIDKDSVDPPFEMKWYYWPAAIILIIGSLEIIKYILNIPVIRIFVFMIIVFVLMEAIAQLLIYLARHAGEGSDLSDALTMIALIFVAPSRITLWAIERIIGIVNSIIAENKK